MHGSAALSAKQANRLETGLATVFAVSARSVELGSQSPGCPAAVSGPCIAVNFTLINGHDIAHSALVRHNPVPPPPPPPPPLKPLSRRCHLPRAAA